jgi:hypothetical protein
MEDPETRQIELLFVRARSRPKTECSTTDGMALIEMLSGCGFIVIAAIPHTPPKGNVLQSLKCHPLYPI